MPKAKIREIREIRVLKNIRVIREIRVQKSRVQKIIIRVQNNLFVFKIQNSKFKTRITVPPDVLRPF